jgi:hypothetical protein
MNSETKILKSAGKQDQDYESKKKKVRPHPDEAEEIKSNSKKMKTGSKTISKSKMSTQKKTEVTFSERVEEIKDVADKENRGDEERNLTPFKTASPSKQSLKSVKEYKKTPYSKIKDESTEDQEKPVLQAAQPNFNSEIIGSAKKSRGTTPNKQSQKKLQASKSRTKSRSKSPLGKIKEEVVDASEKKETEETVQLYANSQDEKETSRLEEIENHKQKEDIPTDQVEKENDSVKQEEGEEKKSKDLS